ncbi:hypothetical protein L3Y34_019260 [Caenorhabditis briggsae]|uniref:Nuclear transport factor 2-like domain-containing protein n=1 Tax=Caenorhabditis briggsae TaxID=6238 RepID=A0AAE9DN77_CAEBR|nr:hypothetical protein L3Y34_019260 [Caenorhabditis briggsae]
MTLNGKVSIKMKLFSYFILVSTIVVCSAQSDQDAIQQCHNFFKGFMRAIEDGDLFKLLAHFSSQSAETNLDAEALLRDLKDTRISFRSAKFVGSNIEVSVIFRQPRSEKAFRSADFVLEKNADISAWTIKSMSDLKGGAPGAKGMLPPLVMG